jgi:hypothetical protein
MENLERMLIYLKLAWCCSKTFEAESREKYKS